MPSAAPLRSRSADETRALGRVLGALLRPGDTIGLSGPLGAGKTCLVQGIASGLGVDRGVSVTSPTFVLVAARSRIVSLASVIAMATMPLAVLLLGSASPVLFVSMAIAICVWIAHRENLRRLRAGTEPRFESRR